jgi:hypothetical protein
LSQRDDFFPRNKRGMTIVSRRKARKVDNLEDLNQSELEFAKAYAAVLKAVGWSWKYISDTLNIQTSLVKSFADDDEWNEMLAKVSNDIVTAAADHLRRSSIDLMEMLIDLARSTLDPAIKLKAIEAGLDRVGLAKVNKSESKVTKDEHKSETHEHAFSQQFLERLEGMPVETQQKLASLMAEADQLLEEGSKTG